MRLLAAFFALLVPCVASADAVSPAPETCPPGSGPSTAHSGPYCRPTAECNVDADCGEGTCGEIMQCVETRDCGGRTWPDAEPCTLEHVIGPCAGDGTCAVGQCRARQVCGGGGGGADGGCGCRVGSASAQAAAPIAVSMALAIALMLRRRRR